MGEGLRSGVNAGLHGVLASHDSHVTRVTASHDKYVTTYLTCKLEELDFGISKPTMDDDVAMATVLVPRERISSSNDQ